MSRIFTLSMLALCSGVALTACGDDGSSSGAGGGSSSSSSSASSSSASTSGTGGEGGSGGETGEGGKGGAGGEGGGNAARTAQAVISSLAGNVAITGTAVFTQTDDQVELKLTLEGCPAGEHVSHLHATKSCDDAGNAAGGHWSPNGEQLGNYTCDAEGHATHLVNRPLTIWTIGDGGPNDVTQFSFMVHAAGDPNAGARIACGLIDAQ